MGLFDTLFGSSSSATSDTNATQATTGSESQTQNQKSTGSSTQNQTTTNLDSNTISLLQGLLPQLAAGVDSANNQDSDAIRSIAQTIQGLTNNDSTTQAAIDAAQAKAKLDFQSGEGAQVAQFQQQIGSKGNTFSQILQSNANADLQTNLVNIVAQAKLQEQQQQVQGLSSAASTLGLASQTQTNEDTAPLNSLLGVIAGLKGATSTTSGTSSTLEDVVSNLQGTSQQNTTQTSTTKGKQNSSPGILPGIASLFSS